MGSTAHCTGRKGDMLSSSYVSYNDLRGQAGLHRLMCSLKKLIDSLVPLGPFLGNMVSQTSSQPSRAYHNITSAHLHTSSSSVYVCVCLCVLCCSGESTQLYLFSSIPFGRAKTVPDFGRLSSTHALIHTRPVSIRFYAHLRKKGHEIFGARNRIERAFVVCCAFP